MNAAEAARAAEWRLQAGLRRLRDLRAASVVREDLQLLSGAGYPLAARITRPDVPCPLPGVVVSPAIHQGLADLDGFDSAVTAAEVARLGYVVLTHDPAGRGKSWGDEDFGGPEHQDDLLVALRHLAAAPGVSSVGVLSLSYGIVAAVGALTRRDAPPVRWLVDWEGPSDREITTTGGTRLVPAAGHALDDEDYWRPREPARHVARLACPYVRLQALPDHAQGADVRHARRMLAAARPRSAWTQVNDHPRNDLPDRPRWLPPGPIAANRAILRTLEDLRG